MIEVRNLTKKYGKTPAVDNLSFTVEKGQIYGFLGPNGAGKSTTMNILTGYIAPSAGEVLINGHNILEEPEEARKCIGYLPETPPVYPEMTVEEYLRFAAGLKKIPKKEQQEQIEKVMELTDIQSMRRRLIRNLSKGYRQRTGLAQAILGSPEVVILDEPMVGLDPKQIIEIRDLIRSLAEKHTVILSSHILSEISVICDHIMIISHGKLVASDTPENLTKMMQGSGTLELTVQASEQKLRETVKGLENVESFELKPSEEKDAFDVTIKTGADQDLRAQIFYLFAERKMTILRMQQTHVSLEDVFLELTESPQADSNAAESETAQGAADAAKTGIVQGDVGASESGTAQGAADAAHSGNAQDDVGASESRTAWSVTDAAEMATAQDGEEDRKGADQK